MNSTPDDTLVILTPGFAENEADTTCLPLQQDLVRQIQIDNPGLAIHILSFQYPYFKKTYNWNGIPVTAFDGRNKGGLSRLLLRRRIHKVLKEIHARQKVGAILSFWYGECAVSGHRFGKKFNVPHLCWILGQDARPTNDYPTRFKLNTGELVALSDFLQEEFKKNHGID